MLMLMLVIMAMALLIVLVVVMVLMLMLVIMAMALLAVLMVVMVLMLMLVCVLQHLSHHFFQGVCPFDSLQDRLAIQLIQGCGNDRRLAVVLANHGNTLRDLCIAGLVGSAQDDRTGILDLIDKELTEVLAVHLCLTCIHYRNSTVYLHV